MSDEIEKNQTVIDTHEKFMRQASKQMVENLIEINQNVRTVRSWVIFFGIVSLLMLIIGILF